MDIEEDVKISKQDQESLFEEELRKSNISITSDSSKCKYCDRMMSDMKKTAVRWLYMEWYKKAVLGLNLPSISELTPNLSNTLKERYQDKEACKDCGSNKESKNIDQLIDNTLKPVNQLTEMYSALPVHYSGNNNGMNTENLISVSSINENENESLAASFFVRAAQRLNLASKPKSRKQRKKKDPDIEDNRYVFITNFSELIMRNPPQPPPSLFKHGTIKRGDGHGKVRLILRIVNRKNKPESCLSVDHKKKQVLLREPNMNTEPLRWVEKEPRLFSFDGIYDTTSSQAELCAGTLVDLIQTVVNGNDSCLLTYGYPKLGKTSIMVGNDNTSESLGLVPCAISWLYQLIDDRKQRTGARFSVRVSAVEVVGKSENLKDLLGEQGNGSVSSSSATSPSLYLPRERTAGVQLSDFTELRAPNPDKAAFYFDAAVTARTKPQHVYLDDTIEDNEETKNSSMIFTLHVYQYMIDKVGTGEIHGGRSRFHLIDLSGCSRRKKSRDTGQGSWLPLSALGSVIVSLANGAKHIPHRDSKLTTLLREAMGPLSARITLIANVSQDPRHCSEALSTFQLTSRIHRSRKKKSRYSSTSSSGGESSCDEKRKHRRRCKPVAPLFKTEACQSDNIGESEFTSTAAEESCDTVIYRGPKGGAISDRELTDFEHPPKIFSKKPLSQRKTQDLKIARVPPNNTKGINQNKKLDNSDKKNEPIVVSLEGCTLKRTPSLEKKAKHLFSNKKQDLSNNPSTCIDTTPLKIFQATRKTNNLPECIPHHTNERTCSLKIQDTSYDQDFSTFLPNKTFDGYDSSPCKKGANYMHTEYNKKTSSLDRALIKSENRKKLSHEQKTLPEFQSTDTVSSTGTVDNFERNLVSQIAERFALEDEFEKMDHEQIGETNNTLTQSQDFFIDDELDTITVGLDCVSPFDGLGHDEDLGILNNRKSLVEQSVERYNDVISCNYCIGQCQCKGSVAQKKVSVIKTDVRRGYDSADDTVEKTNKEIRFRSGKNRHSYSSIDSHLDSSPKHYKHRPSSEGVSSGYESMRCESSANLHQYGYENERSMKDSRERTIYEISDEIDCAQKDNELDKSAPYRNQIKELLEKRQDLKDELHLTLKKLVLNKTPLPDIDERLKTISMQSKDSKRILTRENRILERKVRVCKSHLQIVDSMASPLKKLASPQKSRDRQNKNIYKRFTEKIKSKLPKTPTNIGRTFYKVTQV